MSSSPRPYVTMTVDETRAQRAQRMRNWRARNPERAKAIAAAYRRRHPAKIAAKLKTYCEKNRRELYQKKKAYLARNRDKLKQWKRADYERWPASAVPATPLLGEWQANESSDWITARKVTKNRCWQHPTTRRSRRFALLE